MQGKEYELVNQLAVLLLKNGDRILNGDSKLSLTTQSLSLLNLSFKRYSESKYGESSTSRNKKYQEQLQKWKFNVQYLHDFITKALSLKITHTSVTMQGPILISRFKSVQVLELKRVPIHMLEGLHKLRGQLRTVIVSRCLNSLQDFFEVCGGDQSSPMSWPSLKCIFLSYNGLKKLDSSLRLLPVLEVIDLSHNDLVKTESFLEHLTDIVRVNLGYNGLDSIPSFSLTARSHIKTLVLRNNNLDNIEGIEELCYIEELDISENCLCDHSCLTGLSRLTRLVMLSLQGNPLSFHISHRSLTLQHISVASGSSLAFTLDGKKITSSERELSQRSLLTSSLRPSQEAWDIVTHRDIVLQREGIAASYSFDDSDDIATSLKVGSPGRRRSRKKKQRAKSTGISDEETVDSSMTEYSSRDSSRATSPDRQEEKEDVRDSARSTKEEIQVLRDHYGENWLQVIAAKNEEKLASSASSRDVDKTETEDDIYLNESTANLTISGSRGSRDELETHTTKDKEVEDDIEVLPEPDINMQGSEQEPSITPKATSDHSVYSFYRQHSSQGTEWNRMSDEDQSEYYGSESEPFIVTLSGDKPVQLLISVNNRYLIEKNINGDIVELLDLKCLDSFVITMGTVSDEISLPVCRIKFDYLRKDRRERKYVMEDDDKAQELKELLQPFLNAKEIDRQMKGLLQCLKCSKQFDKTTAEVHIHLPEKKDLISLSEVMIKENAVKYKCPKCNSDMVVELDTEELPSSLQNTPVGSYRTGFSLSSSYKANGSTPGSPMAKSVPKNRRQSSSSYDIQDGSAKMPPPIMSNSSFVSRTFQQTAIQKSYSTGSAMCDMDKSKSIENPDYMRNGSWSDVNKSMDGNHVCKRSSMDSDITILTNDSSSITVISESSNETLAENQSGDVFADLNENKTLTLQNLSLPVGKLSHSSSPNSDVETISRKLAGISEEVSSTTPFGSPLSSSICSSMVSSIYENTITSPSSENIHQESQGSYKNCDNGSTVNNNGHEKSIYDIYTTTNDNDKFDEEVDNKRKISINSETVTLSETTEQAQSMNDVSEDVLNDNSHLNVLNGYCDIDFTKIDHRLKLFITMNFLEENDTEQLHCACKADMMQYMDTIEFPGYLVISTARILIFRFTGDENSDDYGTCLKCIENQPITELRYIDIGLGYQSLRFEFSTVCSSYTLIIRDEDRCKQFINIVTRIVQDTAFSENSELQGISKYNAETMDNLTQTVMEGLDEEEIPFHMVKYLCGILVQEEDKVRTSIGLVITDEELILVNENHQWPIPRLQAPLDAEFKGQQFTIKDRQKINNIATVEICEDDTTQIRLTFFNEESQQEVSWHISMETDAGVLSLVSAIKEPWETEFGVDLDVTPVSFLSDS